MANDVYARLLGDTTLPQLVFELQDARLPRIDALIALGIIGPSALYVLTAWCGSAAFGASVDVRRVLV